MKTVRASLLTVGLVATLPACGGDRGSSAEDALEAYRPVAARLTNQPGHSACAPGPAETISCAGESPGGRRLAAPRCSTPPSPSQPAFDILTALTGDRAGKDMGETERAWRALRSALMWQSGPQPLRRAVDHLEAAATTPAPRVLSDLSAAYITLAELTGSPEDLIRGYELAQAALAARPESRAALFNSALVLSRFRLQAPAADAWQEFLRHEPEGAWAEEARRRLEQLGRRRGPPGGGWPAAREAIARLSESGEREALRRRIDPFRQQTREWASRELFAEWARAVEAGDRPRAEETLALIESIGEVLAGTTGDPTLLEAAAAARAGDGDYRRQLARAQLRFDAGYRHLYEDWDLALAVDELRAARDNPAFLSTPFYRWAELYLALAAYYGQEFARAQIELDRLSASVSPKSHPILAARVSWIRGLVAYTLQLPEASKESYLEAARLFCHTDERQNLAATLSLLASAHQLLGNHAETWRVSYGAFRRIDQVFEPLRHAAILEDTVNNAERQGHLRAALAFAEEHVAVAHETSSASVVHNAHMRRATIRSKLGDQDGAARDFATAMSSLESLPTPDLRRRSDADRDLKQAAAEVEDEPRRAIDLASRSLAFYLDTRTHANVPEALAVRAAANLALDRMAEAERDLRRQVEVLELARQGVISASDRARYAESMSGALEGLVRLASLDGRSRDAFRWAELAAVVGFDDWLRPRFEAPAAGNPLGMIPAPEILQRSLGDREAALTYFALEERLLVWLLTREEFLMRRLAIPAAELDRLLEDHHRQVRSDSADRASRLAQELYRRLLVPLSELDEPPTQLVVAAGGPLGALPFETLVNPETGRYLLREASIMYTPSLTLHRELARRADLLRSTAQPRVLAVHGHSAPFDRLPRLPGAEREARKVASLFAEGRYVDASSLAPGQLEVLLGRSDIFHFAGHALLAIEPVRETRLVLGGSGNETNYLRPSDLDDERLSGLQLVTLSACATLSSPDVEVGTLARPFLAAGVPLVVGSRWAVDDRVAEALFERFYEGLADGSPPGRALQAARLSLLDGGDAAFARTRAWSAFSGVGASPEPPP